MFGTKIYTVQIKPGIVAAAEKPVFIKEGFNVYAFLFGVVWALYQRLWLAAVLMMVFNVSVVWMVKHHVLLQPSAACLQLGFILVVGYSANDWLRTKYARRGYVMTDVTAANTKLTAEQRYFERYLAHTA